VNARLNAERGDTLINPPWLNPESYLAFLNAAFPGCWDQRAYDWYMGRTFNGRSGDLLVRARGSRVLSGMALLPRQILVGDCAIDVCVISAAATLPSERGCGHYATLLRAAAECARERQYTAVLGFVTRDNPSGRPLLKMGALGIPSFYISSVSGPQIRHPACATGPRLRLVSGDSRQSGLDCAGMLGTQRGIPTGEGALTSSAQFHYANEDDWRSQFTRRPHSVRLVKFEQNLLGLIETVHGTDRLQWLSCPPEGTLKAIGRFATLSAASRRAFFMYTLDSDQAAGARRLGLKVRDGYLLVLPSGYCCERWRTLASASWHVQSGDRL
jgi:hypothetical protein